MTPIDFIYELSDENIFNFLEIYLETLNYSFKKLPFEYIVTRQRKEHGFQKGIIVEPSLLYYDESYIKYAIINDDVIVKYPSNDGKKLIARGNFPKVSIFGTGMYIPFEKNDTKYLHKADKRLNDFYILCKIINRKNNIDTVLNDK
jgi:hypothetical protein